MPVMAMGAILHIEVYDAMPSVAKQLRAVAHELNHVSTVQRQKLQSMLNNQGYFGATINVMRVPSGDYNVVVHAGTRYRIEHVNSNVKDVKQFRAFQGQYFDGAALDSEMSRVLSGFRNKGYLDATVSSVKLHPDHQNNTVVVDANINKGKPYVVASIHNHIKGFSSWLFQQYFKDVHVGHVVDMAHLDNIYYALSRAGVLRSVVIDSQKQKKHKVSVSLKGSLNYASELSMGAGYNSDYGAQVIIDHQWNRLNRFGHQLFVHGMLGQRYQTISTTYSIPGPNVLNMAYGVNLLYTNQIPESIGQTRYTDFELFFKHFKKKSQWNAGVHFLRSRTDYTDQPEIKSELPYVSISKEWLPQQSGKWRWYGHFTVDTNPYQNSVWQRFLSIDQDWIVKYQFTGPWMFVGHYGLGEIWVDNLISMPMPLQFYLGGGNTLRGYEYKALGPGSHYYLASHELRYFLRPMWYVGVFKDIGMVGETWHALVDGSYGVTVGYHAAFADFAASIGRPDHDDHWRLQISVML